LVRDNKNYNHAVFSDYVKFVSQLRQTVNDIDCFLNNISAKEEQENSELAKQYQEILKNSEINDTDQP